MIPVLTLIPDHPPLAPGFPAPSRTSPHLTTAHAYTEPGPYTITMTTYYNGEFSVAGGPWQLIDGQAEVTSPGRAVTARTARPQLVAD